MRRGVRAQGGKEAAHSNAILHELIVAAIEAEAPEVGRDLIGLVTSREGVGELLVNDDVIDLVIPRGSNALVRCTSSSSKIRLQLELEPGASPLRVGEGLGPGPIPTPGNAGSRAQSPTPPGLATHWWASARTMCMWLCSLGGAYPFAGLDPGMIADTRFDGDLMSRITEGALKP